MNRFCWDGEQSASRETAPRLGVVAVVVLAVLVGASLAGVATAAGTASGAVTVAQADTLASDSLQSTGTAVSVVSGANETAERAPATPTQERLVSTAGVEMPSSPVGDANRNGEIGIADAQAIANYVIGGSPSPFDANLANVSRASEGVQIADAQRIAEYTIGAVDRAQARMSDSLSVATIEAGAAVSGSTTIENTGEMGTIHEVYYRVATDGGFQTVVHEERVDVVDLAPAGLSGNSTAVQFTADPNVSAGEYSHGLFSEGLASDNASTTSNLTVEAPAEASLSGLDIAGQGGNATLLIETGDTAHNVEINHTVTNVGDRPGSFNVTLDIGTNVSVTQPRTVNASETTTVTFANATGGLAAGTYDVTVSTADDAVTGNLTVQAPAEASLSGLDIAGQGSEATITEGDDESAAVNVTNVGGQAATFNVTLAIGTNVSVTQSTGTVNASEATTVTFASATGGLAAGTYDVTVSTAEDAVTGDLTVETAYAGGNGTEAAPYEVADWFQLDLVRENLGANFTLVSDLTETTAGYDEVAGPSANDGSGFEPIGNCGSWDVLDGCTPGDPFTGSFDGAGHVVDALTIDRPGDSGVGLFSYSSGTVRHLEMAGNVSGDGDVGGLVGFNSGNVTASHVTGAVTGGNWGVGGLVGRSGGSGAVNRSSAAVTVDGSTYVGGMVGENRGTVTASYATGNASGHDNVGGLVGNSVGTVAGSNATGNVSGTHSVGGLIGGNFDSEVTASHATGNAFSSDRWVGGLVGRNLRAEVTDSYATGDVSSGGYAVGGLVGLSDGSDPAPAIERSYATGSVSGNEAVGGLVGRNGDSSSPSAAVTETYAAGPVTGNSSVGGLVGDNSGDINRSYWDETTTGQNSSAGGTGLETGAMKGGAAQGNMTGFDFGGTWDVVDEPADNGRRSVSYPYLTDNSQDPEPGLESLFTQAPFVMTVNSTNSADTGDDRFRIETGPTATDYDVSWTPVDGTGGGGAASGLGGDYTITFDEPGAYQLKFTGQFQPQYSRSTVSDAKKIESLDQWGDIQWESFDDAFYGAKNMEANFSDTPDLSNVTDMSRMFSYAYEFDADLDDWNVSNVETMEAMFESDYISPAFNGNITTWDVSNVVNMDAMFSNTDNFDRNLSQWDVSNVETMSGMFEYNDGFDGNISTWDVSNVTDMSRMFRSTGSFNRSLGDWNVSGVTDMSRMFGRTEVFNRDISDWDVSNVESVGSMFAGLFGSNPFDRDISDWCFEQVPEKPSGWGGDTGLESDEYPTFGGPCDGLTVELFGVTGAGPLDPLPQVGPGENITVAADVSNAGSEQETQELTFTVNDTGTGAQLYESNKNVTLDGGNSSRVRFQYDVDSDQQSGLEFTVESASDNATGSVGVRERASGSTLYVTDNERLYAVDAGTGAKTWYLSFDYSSFESSYSDPTVVNGTVYFTTHNEPGYVFAVDAETGVVEWTVETPDSLRGSPTVVDGTVYIAEATFEGFTDPRNGQMWAINASTGDVQWRFNPPTSNHEWYTSPNVVGDTVYGGTGGSVTSDPRLYAVNASTGEEKWSFQGTHQSEVDFRGSVTRAGDTLYAVSDDGAVYAVDAANGTEQWVRDDIDTGQNPPVIVNGTVYALAAGNDTVHALDASDGTDTWAEPFDAGNIIDPASDSPAAIVVDGTVVVGGDRLYGIDADDGTEQWSTDIDGEVWGTPTADSGIVYVSTDSGSGDGIDGSLYAVDVDTGGQVWSRSYTGNTRDQSFESGPTIVNTPSGDSIGARVRLGATGHNEEFKEYEG